MGIYSEPGLFLVVQVDHLSGEAVGAALGELYGAGASSVQVIPTFTKKNRPAHLVLVDCTPAVQQSVEEVIVRELGTGGWHLVPTEHRHQPLTAVARPVTLTAGGAEVQFVARGKQVGSGPLAIRPEHESCVEMRGVVEGSLGARISLSQANTLLAHALNHDITTIAIPE